MPQSTTRSLSSANWEFKDVKDEKFKNLCSRDGSYRFNGEQSYSRSFYRRKKVQWIKNKDWEYRSHFTITNKGGIYEDDEFDKVCDENGILLLQDFAFAGSFYPYDENLRNQSHVFGKSIFKFRSSIIQAHHKHPRGCEIINKYMERD